MENIMKLKEKFDSLPISDENVDLYRKLFDLDIADFKPVMEGLLSGEIDIEDTRKLFQNDPDLKTPPGVRYDASSPLPMNADTVDSITANIISSLTEDSPRTIKETLTYPSPDTFKNRIAAMYKDQTGITMTPEEVNALIPIIEEELFTSMALGQSKGTRNKADQLSLSDKITNSPIAVI